MNEHDLEISNNMWAYANRLEDEYHAALRKARSYDVKHDLPWPCQMPVLGDDGWRLCGSRGQCGHVD